MSLFLTTRSVYHGHLQTVPPRAFPWSDITESQVQDWCEEQWLAWNFRLQYVVCWFESAILLRLGRKHIEGDWLAIYKGFLEGRHCEYDNQHNHRQFDLIISATWSVYLYCNSLSITSCSQYKDIYINRSRFYFCSMIYFRLTGAYCILILFYWIFLFSL